MANLGIWASADHYDLTGSDGTSNYTPILYANKTLIKFYKTTVFGDIANTDYEGMIKSMGDKVLIRTVPDVTINDYSKDLDLTYEAPESDSVELEINLAKYYALKIDKVDEVQNDLKLMDRWTDDAGKQLAIAIDHSIMTTFHTAADPANKGSFAGAVSGDGSTKGYDLGTDATAKVVTKDDIVDYIMTAEAVLSEQNVPEDEGRWLVLPTWACMLLQTSDLRRADSTGAAAANEVLRNGKLGRLGNFTIYRSNQLPVLGDGTAIPFGHKSSLTFASQLVDTEMLPHPTKFGKIMRGLQVYGWKVVKPQALGYMNLKM